MKGLFFTLSIILCGTNACFSQNVIVVEGNYQGKVLYVQNPFGPGGVGFCVTEVKVNGNITTDETNSSAFEIDLKAHKLEPGDKVEVKIMHKDGCKPRVLNPEVLKPRSTFEIMEISASKDGTLKWSTRSESGKLPFIVEQFRWNKWVKIGEVEGEGSPALHEYSFKASPHSGKNQLRVRQIDYSGRPRVSRTAEFVGESPEVVYSPQKTSKQINFSATKGKQTTPAETLYEIYDQYGNVVKKGYGSTVDVSNLPRGSYYLNFDNKMGEFMKR